MAEAVVSFVVQSLGGFITQEGKFLCGISDQVRHAQLELQLMRGFLCDADARQQDEETIRIWVAEIRDAAYDLEDVIATFAFKVASKRKRGIKNVLKRFGCILIEGVHVRKIGLEIGNITTKISHLRLSLQNYNIRESGGATSLQLHERQQQLRRTYSHVIESDVVGLEDSIKELVMHLVNDEQRHRVVSIWGMGGAGKTTLARQVYHHNEIRHHFACFAWVCISQRCQVRDVWERILSNLTSATNEQREEIAKMKDDEIAKKLYLVQQERRCLVVLDDVWSIETWDSLKAGFPYKETESRILLTTRNKEVASRADRNGFLYQPQPLNDDKSWELFEKIAIYETNTNSGVYGKMKELGKKMLKHCAGLPLAIRVLAGLIARKETINEWDTVLNNVDLCIRRGKFLEQEYEGSSWVLALSYDDLPYHLKLCFLYLGHFPEDFEIPVKRLTQLWMAEGLLFSEERSKTSIEAMEDVSYNCINELVERCMVEVGKQGSVRKIKTCRLHDLMRDLCLLKAEEEKFLQIVNCWHRNEAVVTKETPISKVRRLSIYLDKHSDKCFPPNDENYGHLRSLMYFAPGPWMSTKKLIRSLCKDFKLLRVLKFEHMTREVKLPNEIGDLVHLRFLSLKGSNVKQLPSSAANLVCLQTLDLRFIGLSIIPNVIWKMEHLRHLYLPRNVRVSDKLQLATLSNLQTLVNASCRDCDSNHLAQNLRKLCTVVSGGLKNLEEMFKSTNILFDRLRSLSVVNFQRDVEVMARIVLSCRYIYKLHLEGPTIELPNDLLHYPNLTKLSLVATFLKDDQMEILEKLPYLKILHLGPCTFEENTNTLVCSREGFPHLEFLYLGGMLELEEWRVEEGAMPSLCRLLIAHCEHLSTLPDGLRYITTLKKLVIKAMPRTFYSRLKEGGEDFCKIQHVPSVELGATLDEFLSSLEKVIQ